VSRGSVSKPKWGILKYLFAEIFPEKTQNIPGHMTCASKTLGQKLGYDRLKIEILLNSIHHNNFINPHKFIKIKLLQF